MPSVLYIGLDIGGTLSKVALASETLNIPPYTNVQLRGKKYAIHLTRFNDVFTCLDWLKERIGEFDSAKLSVTGGGATKYKQIIDQKFAGLEISTMNEFDACAIGFNFLKQGQISIIREKYIKDGPNNVTKTRQQTTLKECQLPLLFICVGSGVSMHKIGEGENGFERLKAGESLYMDGSCLGGSYIFGLIKLLSKQKDSSKIIELIKTNSTYGRIYSGLLTNILQLGLEASKTHQLPTIVPTGSIFSIKPAFEFFEQAFKVNSQTHLERQVVSLAVYEGFIGTAGLIYDLIRKQNP